MQWCVLMSTDVSWSCSCIDVCIGFWSNVCVCIDVWISMYIDVCMNVIIDVSCFAYASICVCFLVLQWCALTHWNVLHGEYCFVLICTHAQDIFNIHQELCLACQITNHGNCMWTCKSHSHLVWCVWVFDSYLYMFHRFQKKSKSYISKIDGFPDFFFEMGVS